MSRITKQFGMGLASAAALALLLSGCTAASSGTAAGACDPPSLAAADGQSLTVEVGDRVELVGLNLTGQCGDVVVESSAPAIDSEEYDILWEQGETSTAVGSVQTSDSSETAIEFDVPADAATGTATVSVNGEAVELNVEG